MLLTKKLANQCNLPIEMATAMIVANHELEMTPKKKLTTLQLEIDDITKRRIEKISKILKINIDSIVLAVLENAIEKEKII